MRSISEMLSDLLDKEEGAIISYREAMMSLQSLGTDASGMIKVLNKIKVDEEEHHAMLMTLVSINLEKDRNE